MVKMKIKKTKINLEIIGQHDEEKNKNKIWVN